MNQSDQKEPDNQVAVIENQPEQQPEPEIVIHEVKDPEEEPENM